MTKSLNQIAPFSPRILNSVIKHIYLGVVSYRLMVKVPRLAWLSSRWRLPNPRPCDFPVVLRVLLQGLP